MPRYFKDAVNTAIGRAHPISGYQLDSNKDLASPAAYYKPNQSVDSFIDPAASLTPAQLVFFQRDGLGSLGVTVALHSRYDDLGPVTWAWGDATANTVGNWVGRHVYAAAGTYTVTATATSASKGAVTANVSIIVDTATAAPANTVAPALSTQAPVYNVPVTVTAGTWTNSGTITYQWQVAGVNGTGAGATTDSYTPVAGDETKILSVIVTNTNSEGSTSVTETCTTAVAA